MFRSSVSMFVVGLSFFGLVACSGGSGDQKPASEESTNQPASSDDKSSNDGSGDAKTSDKSSSSDANVGPQCTAYFDCCKELSDAQPSLGTSCDSAKKSASDAIAQGGAPANFESGCKQALQAVQGAGYCK
jgi:hypothetical protein